MTEKQPLQQQLDDYRWLFETSETAMIILDKDGYYLDYNKAYYQLMGYTDKTELKRFHPENVSPDLQPDGQKSFEKANRMIEIALDNGKHEFEWMHRRPDGFEFLSHVKLDVIQFNGQQCIRAVIKDISEIKKLERLVDERTRELAIKNKELEHLAIIDPLTNLYNRRKFDAIMAYIWNASLRSKECLAIVFLDIDHFKLFNDHYGHSTGDVCLEKIAQVLKKITRRKTDYVARYGGEEFVIIIPDASKSFIRQMVKDILEAVKALRIPHIDSPTDFYVTVSIGCAVTIPGNVCQQATELLDAADDAMYQVKNSGRNHYKIIELN